MAEVTLEIVHGNTFYRPVVLEDIQWETERKGSPSKLTFTILEENWSGKFAHGDPVRFYYGGKKVFFGFLFKFERSKDGKLKCTAYDQLRYFKNKHTYQYTNKRADQLVTMIAKDFELKTGTLEKTSYVIGARLEDDQTLFDIVQNALDLTVMNSGNLYVLYDDFGALNLKNIESMKTDVLLDSSTAGDYGYTYSIDDETYNRIVLFYDNDETNKRETFVKYSSKNMDKWGVLQYTESLQTNVNANKKAEQLLKLYNRASESLKVTGAFGDIRCRAGASCYCQLNFGDRKVDNYMVIEKATHKFNLDRYTMDLTLSGANRFTA